MLVKLYAICSCRIHLKQLKSILEERFVQYGYHIINRHNFITSWTKKIIKTCLLRRKSSEFENELLPKLRHSKVTKAKFFFWFVIIKTQYYPNIHKSLNWSYSTTVFYCRLFVALPFSNHFSYKCFLLLIKIIIT